MQQRISRWWALAAVVFALTLAACGGGGTPDAASSEPTDSTEGATATTVESSGGAACGGVTSLATAVGPTLRVTAADAVAAKSDDFRSASSALSGYASQAPADLQVDIASVTAGWDDVAGRLYELELQSGSPDPTSVKLANEHIGETLAEPGFADSSAKVLAWLESEVAQCPDSDTTDEALGGKQLGEVDDKVTAAANEVLSQQTEADPLSAPLGSEVRNCRKARELSEQSLIAPGGAGYICELWRDGELKFDGAPVTVDADGNVVSVP